MDIAQPIRKIEPTFTRTHSVRTHILGLITVSIPKPHVYFSSIWPEEEAIPANKGEELP